MTTAANAILVLYTAPVHAALLGAWLLHERVARLNWLTIAIVLGGMSLFFVDKLTPGGLILLGVFQLELSFVLEHVQDHQ